MISKLRHRIVIEQATESADSHGGFTTTWSEYARAWADIKPMSAKEQHFADKLEEEVTHKIKMRYLNGLSTTMRINFEGRIFKITGIRNLEERDRFMEVMAFEETST